MSNGIRPSGAGHVSTPSTTAVENKIKPEKTTPAKQQSETTESNGTARSNANAMRGDLGFSGQINQMVLENAVLQADADPNAANNLRVNTLPPQLEKANVPKNVREDLLKQMSGKSGPELKQLLDKTDKALASKDPAGEVKSVVLQGKVDAYMDSFNSTYEIGGKKVEATPHFRMTDGASGPAGRKETSQVRADLQKLIEKHDKGKPKDQQLWNKEMHDAVRFTAAGKPSADQVKMVTDALIKSGEFEKAKAKHPGLSDSETIRMMQWNHGIGIDCAGYVSQAFVEVHGATRGKFKLQSVSDENLMYLKGNPNFTQVKPADVRPGDLIALDPPTKGDVGHTALVRDHHIATTAEQNGLTDLGAQKFSKDGDKIHVYEVDASWSAGPDGSLKGGLVRKTWLFNEDTGKWALTRPDGKGGLEINTSSMNGPYHHPMNGIFRPKGE
ncbi:hypothetical protein L0222_17720 [bacterium]|nr:hypothetical protein [bacterium]